MFAILIHLRVKAIGKNVRYLMVLDYYIKFMYAAHIEQKLYLSPPYFNFCTMFQTIIILIIIIIQTFVYNKIDEDFIMCWNSKLDCPITYKML